MGIWDKFKPREKHESFGDVSMPQSEAVDIEKHPAPPRPSSRMIDDLKPVVAVDTDVDYSDIGAHAHPQAETLTIRIHQDKKKRWRVTVVDMKRERATLLIRAGFGFEDWYDARAFANRIAAARFEIETTRDDALE